MSTAAVTEIALKLTLRASSAQAPGTVYVASHPGPSQLGLYMHARTDSMTPQPLTLKSFSGSVPAEKQYIQGNSTFVNVSTG